MTDYKKATAFRREGLTEEEVRRSAEKFGRNVLTKKRGKSFFRRFLGML